MRETLSTEEICRGIERQRLDERLKKGDMAIAENLRLKAELAKRCTHEHCAYREWREGQRMVKRDLVDAMNNDGEKGE